MNAAPTGVVVDRSEVSVDLDGGGAKGVVAAFAGQTLGFRAFTLLPSARILLRDGRPIEIGSRAFDLLHVLLRSRGLLVEREKIMRQVWPTTMVEESNLRVQVSALRKALGEDRDLLKTVPGRGYLLAIEVTASDSRGRETTTEALRTLLDAALNELRELARDNAGGLPP